MTHHFRNSSSTLSTVIDLAAAFAAVSLQLFIHTPLTGYGVHGNVYWWVPTPSHLLGDCPPLVLCWGPQWMDMQLIKHVGVD